MTVDGLRSAFSDWCAEDTGFSSEAREMAMAHAVGNKVEVAYRRGALFMNRRDLADIWAQLRWAKVIDFPVEVRSASLRCLSRLAAARLRCFSRVHATTPALLRRTALSDLKTQVLHRSPRYITDIYVEIVTGASPPPCKSIRNTFAGVTMATPAAARMDHMRPEAHMSKRPNNVVRLTPISSQNVASARRGDGFTCPRPLRALTWANRPASKGSPATIRRKREKL